jgi:hypothetical protein
MYDHESRAHGTHGFWGGAFTNTDETGMREDVQRFVRMRKRILREEFLAAHTGEPVTERMVGDHIRPRIEQEYQAWLANPSLRAVINDELSGQLSPSGGAQPGQEADAYLLDDGGPDRSETQISPTSGR